MAELLFADLTSAILDCYYQVYNSPSSRGLSEASLIRALAIELRKRGLRIQQNVTIAHRYENRKIGSGRVDLVVESKVLVEVKRLVSLRERDKEHMRTNLLEGGYAVGLLLNFGKSQPDYRRVYESRNAPRPVERAEGGDGDGI